MSEDTKFEEPGDEELINDDKLFRKHMLYMHRERREDDKLLKKQVWGDVHATPPTNGLVRDVNDLKKDQVDKVANDKWFKRIVVGSLSGLSLGGIWAYISSHWH